MPRRSHEAAPMPGLPTTIVDRTSYHGQLHDEIVHPPQTRVQPGLTIIPMTRAAIAARAAWNARVPRVEALGYHKYSDSFARFSSGVRAGTEAKARQLRVAVQYAVAAPKVAAIADAHHTPITEGVFPRAENLADLPPADRIGQICKVAPTGVTKMGEQFEIGPAQSGLDSDTLAYVAVCIGRIGATHWQNFEQPVRS